ncbi:hypothetical protein ABMA70_01785 [Halobacteriovorax sp. XZX-3]|uniref:hypothetical protein n=1 Tax=unclassified Halobacteriovorax TaxID=2639665 RepID=UPI000CD04261|nr:hypothetical protein [Halobacteriovorax sp. DA5]POB14478.1 hypothetical protein C0Z22_05130 [Halobacteriovorax sp. DA5]
MNRIILTLLLSFIFISSNASAKSTARFQFDFEITNMLTNEIVISAECEVTQVLEWNNSLNVFNCNVGEGDNFLIKNVSHDLGYDYTRSSAYTNYYLSGSGGLVTQLFKYSKLDYAITNAGMIDVYYKGRRPSISSVETMVETEEDVFLFSVTKIEYL